MMACTSQFVLSQTHFFPKNASACDTNQPLRLTYVCLIKQFTRSITIYISGQHQALSYNKKVMVYIDSKYTATFLRNMFFEIMFV